MSCERHNGLSWRHKLGSAIRNVRRWLKSVPVIGPILRYLFWWIMLPRRVIQIEEKVNMQPMYYIGQGMIVAHIHGFRMCLPTNEAGLGMTSSMMWGREWEHHVTRVFYNVVKDGLTVVDVGANIGYYTLLGARLVGERGRVYALEPEPGNFRLLQRNVKLNMFHPRVTLVQAAASNRMGKAELLIYDNTGWHSMFQRSDAKASGHVTVETVRLDDILKDEQDIGLVKIDVEGAEPLVIDGMRGIIQKQAQLKIIMEFAPDNIRCSGVDPRGFLKDLSSLGLRRKLIRPDGTTREIDDDTLLRTPFCYVLLQKGED